MIRTLRYHDEIIAGAVTEFYWDYVQSYDENLRHALQYEYVPLRCPQSRTSKPRTSTRMSYHATGLVPNTKTLGQKHAGGRYGTLGYGRILFSQYLARAYEYEYLMKPPA